MNIKRYKTILLCILINILFYSCLINEDNAGNLHGLQETIPPPGIGNPTPVPPEETPTPDNETPAPNPETPTSTPDNGTPSPIPAGETFIAVDHTCTDISIIPDEWISEAKKLIVHSAGQSHSTQITKGLELLYKQDSRYAYDIVNKLDSPATDMLILVTRQRNSTNTDWETGYVGEEHYWATETAREMATSTLQYAMDMGNPFTASVWLWCSVDIGRENRCYNEDNTLITFNDERRDTYFSSLITLGQNYPQTKIVYVTSVTDVAADHNGERVTRYNDDIRNEAKRVGGILFDQAAMENWNLDNTEQRIDTWDGHTLYLRHSDYDENSGANTFDGDHTNDALCLRKAKAFWWLMARIAGWDGNS